MSRDESPPDISVVIPVYNDRARLLKCIQALREQTLAANQFEIIIIDNNSSERLLIESANDDSPTLKVFRECRIGSYAARNLGILKAKGRFVAFTDSDCVPAATWLEEGLKTLQSISCEHLVGGAITLSFIDPNAPGTLELYDRAIHLRQKHYVLHHGFSATANMMTSRRAFDVVGLFRSDLKSKGDMEWCERALIAGFRLIYVETVLVSHPCRGSLATLIKKNRRTVGGICDRFAKQGWREILGKEAKELYRKYGSITESIDGRQWRSRAAMYCLLFFFEALRLLEMMRIAAGGRTTRD